MVLRGGAVLAGPDWDQPGDRAELDLAASGRALLERAAVHGEVDFVGAETLALAVLDSAACRLAREVLAAGEHRARRALELAALVAELGAVGAARVDASGGNGGE